MSERGGARAESYGLLFGRVCGGLVEVVVHGCFERVVGALGRDGRWAVERQREAGAMVGTLIYVSKGKGEIGCTVSQYLLLAWVVF